MTKREPTKKLLDNPFTKKSSRKFLSELSGAFLIQGISGGRSGRIAPNEALSMGHLVLCGV